MLKKRGISQVVATLLLVLVTIAAITIIVQYLVPFVKHSLAGTNCVKYRDYYTFDNSFSYNCYAIGGVYAVSVRAGSDEQLAGDIRGFNLMFSGDGASNNLEIRDGAYGSCGSSGVSNLHDCNTTGMITPFQVPRKGEIRTYIFNSANNSYARVKISPVITSEGNEVACDPTVDSVEFVPCEGVRLP